ncbi:Pentatricopeptide repeat-containing protein [Platanthera zijinensis]|uniref:Pentatricopeptide repeat-containing protein n=1 Tax=Platanthera zijinensis TaxID=2320716 RepID=A0AAP0BAT5_9ASPA
MWRSRAPVLILRQSIIQNFIPPPRITPAWCILAPSAPSKWYTRTFPAFLNPKFFSSATESSPEDDETSHSTLDLGGNPDFPSQEADRFSSKLGESDISPVAFKVELDENEIEETGEATADDVPVVNTDQLDSVVSILQSTLPQEIELSLNKLEELSLTEEFVLRVFQDAHVSGENLVSFFRFAIKKEESVRTSTALHLLIQTISASDEIGKMEAYMLWDLIKDFVKIEGIVVTEMLNQLISIFWKLGKAKAALEVFNKFSEFGCTPDGNSFYYTIESLGKKSMIDRAWSVCEKMLDSGNLPDPKKIGNIIIFFCKGKKAKDAHSIYMLAKKNDIFPGTDALSYLIGSLCRNDEHVHLAMELLEDHPQKSLRYRNNAALVVKSLTRMKDAKAAKTLLLRMIDSGPFPKKSAFNFVITLLCKDGEVEDAISLTKVMERGGLRPDVYTYSVIMSGFAKAGLMDEAFKIFCEAKKYHKVLTPVTYHILIRGFCKMEEYEKALECLKDSKEHGVQPNSDEYNKLIKTLCLKALDWRTAEKLSEEMKESGLHLDEATHSLIAAVKTLEEEQMEEDESKTDA